MQRKKIAAVAGAAVLAALPTAMAFADFSPSGGNGGTGGTTGSDQGYSQGVSQGYSAGAIDSGASISATGTILFSKGGGLNASQHTRTSVRGRNSNRAGNANGGRGGNAVNRF